MARKASRLTEPATCSLDGSYRLSFWRPFVSKSATSPKRLALHDLSITENNSIVRGESMDILNGYRRVINVKLPFSWSNRIVRCGKSRRHHKFLEPGGREYEEIV